MKLAMKLAMKAVKGNKGKGTEAKPKVAKGKAGGTQKVKAKVHAMRVMKRPAKKVPEEQELEDEVEGEEEEEVANEEEEEETQLAKPTGKDWYHFNSKLATAPKGVQEAVAKLKAMPARSGKMAKLQEMALAFAKSKWNHKLFKAIESVEMERAQKKEAKVYPRQVMATKCGGEEGLLKARANFTVRMIVGSCPQCCVSHWTLMYICILRLWSTRRLRRFWTQRTPQAPQCSSTRSSVRLRPLCTGR